VFWDNTEEFQEVLNILILEGETTMLSQNVRNQLPCNAVTSQKNRNLKIVEYIKYSVCCIQVILTQSNNNEVYFIHNTG
jgi:hypothetical protein